MALDSRTLAAEFLELDDKTKAQLIQLAQALLKHREPLAASWRDSLRESAGMAELLGDAQAVSISNALLDLFFNFVPRGDIDGYYAAILEKGRECQAASLPYSVLLLAVHHIEQVALPFLGRIYRSQKDLEHSLVALDRLCDNAIVLIASSYFEMAMGELRALQQVTDTGLSTLDIDQLLRSLLLRMVEAIKADGGAIMLFDESTGELQARCYVGIPAEGGGVAQDIGGGSAEGQLDEGSSPGAPLPLDARLRKAGMAAAASIPLRVGSRRIGTVQVGRLSGAAFDLRETQLLEVLAERAAAAVEHAQLYQRTAHLLRQTAALQRVTTSITARMALPQLLEVVIDGVGEVFGAQRVAIYLQNIHTGEVTCPASRGLSFELIAALRRHYGVVREGQGDGSDGLAGPIHFYVPDVRRDAALGPLGDALGQQGIRTILVLPFGQPPEANGALCLLHDEVRRYEDEERRLAQTFADQTAIAIAHATLYIETRQRAAELDRMNSELQTLDHMKADFLAMVSHELRTPLTAILGYTDLLLRGARGELGERPAGDLRTIRSNSHRLLALINDLIDFSSIEAGGTSVTPRPLQLGRLVPQVLRSFEDQAEARSIGLSLEIPAELPPVYADSSAVEKVLAQLLSNAIKFSLPEGSVVVKAMEAAAPLSALRSGAIAGRGAAASAGKHGAEEARRSIVVSVSDKGVGIPEGQLSRIWDHFYQVDSSSARRYGGAGLGLAIVKRLIEVQGGTVWAESAGVPGQGATFSFSLPVANSTTATKG